MPREYIVEHIAGTTITDITRHVVSLDRCLFADSFYKICTASVMLSAKAGRFVTRAVTDTTIKTPIINHLDIIKITIKGRKPSASEQAPLIYKYFFVEGILPQESASGNQLVLELAGFDRFLEKMQIPGHWVFRSALTVAKEIIKFWNDHRGTAQPEIITTEADGTTSSLHFDDSAFGTFDFGDGISVLDALRRIVAWLNLPEASGGVNRMHSLVFEDISTTQIRLRIAPQGRTAGTDVQQSDNDTTRVVRTYEEYAANMVILRGESGAGTWPTTKAMRTGKIEEYRNFPDWRSDIAYRLGAYVRHGGNVYQSRRVNAAENRNKEPPNTGYWTAITEGTYVEGLGAIFPRYSPWTSNLELYKAPLLNSGTLAPTDATDPSLDYPAFVDSNLIIRERTNRNPNGLWQDEVIMRTSSISSIPAKWRLGGSTGRDGLYEGMKVLFTGTAIATSVGGTGGSSDKNGRTYKDAVIQYSPQGNWIVKKEPERGDCVVVRSETKVYEYQRSFPARSGREDRDAVSSGTLAWRDISGTPNGNHCFHYPHTIRLVDSNNTIEGGVHHVNSAIEVWYEYVMTDNLLSLFSTLFRALFADDVSLQTLIDAALSGLLYSRDWFGIGWWITLFEAPMPVQQYGTTKVGDIYKQPVLDANNRNYTASGGTGYTASDATMLDTLDGFGFDLNLDVRIVLPGADSGGTRMFQGALTIRATIYDTEDNVWVADKQYRLVGNTERLQYLFSEFSIYKARAPLEWYPNIQNIAPAELFTPEIPERRKIKRITLQIQDVYDEYGRYDPSRYSSFLERLGRALTGATLRHVGWVDAFAFVKSPIAIAKHADADKYPLMKPVQTANISNVEQLKKAAQAELALALHRNDVYTIEQPIRDLDLHPANAFHLRHPYLINDAEKAGAANTKRLVVADINYMDSKSRGLVRQVHAIKEVGT